jgi:hypothetical protein
MNYYIISSSTAEVLFLYTIDPNKLFKAVSGNQHHMMIVRWCLDFMFVVKKSHIVNIDDIMKAWPFDESLFLTDAISSTPEYLSIIMGKDDNNEVFSRVLKRHFEQERIMKQLGQDKNLEDLSVAQKIKSSYGEQELDVLRDIKGIAMGEYSGLFPTRSYDINREVFSVTGSFYSYLSAKYPRADVDEKLKEAHAHFVNNSMVRRHCSGMKRYLEGWVSGDLLKLNKMRRAKPQMNNEDFYTDFLNDD